MKTVDWIARAGSGTGLPVALFGVGLWAVRVPMGVPVALVGTGLMFIGAAAGAVCLVVYSWRSRRRRA